MSKVKTTQRTRRTYAADSNTRKLELMADLIKSWRGCADILEGQPGQGRAVATYRECADEAEAVLLGDLDGFSINKNDNQPHTSGK